MDSVSFSGVYGWLRLSLLILLLLLQNQVCFFFFRAHYLYYKLSKSRWGLTWRTPKNVCVWVEGLIGRILWVAQMPPPLLMFSYRFNKAFVYPLFYRMYGLFQTTFYFGYMALFSAGLGIMCGKCYGTLMLLLTKMIDIATGLLIELQAKKVLQYNIWEWRMIIAVNFPIYFIYFTSCHSSREIWTQ